MYPVRIYDKSMNLLKTITSTELSETFWREKSRKKDAKLTDNELRNLGERRDKKIDNIYETVCPTCGKKAIQKSAVAKYCSDKCRNISRKRRDDESKAKRYNTGRKGKKGLR